MSDIIKFNKVPALYWETNTKLSYLQRKILVYSYFYYQLNKSIITDAQFDSLSYQYIRMVNELNKNDIIKTRYYYVFKDFEGFTSYDLFFKLNEKDSQQIRQLANVISNYNGSGKS